jgi:hypothetical protein
VPGEALESLFGIYIFSTDSEQLVKRHSFEEIRSSLHLPPGQRFVLLSDVFDFLERGGLYNPAVGLGVVQISCNTFYSMKNGEKRIITPFNIWADKNTVQSCIALENMYHIADAEYRALDLLDAREFDRKYPIFGAVLPVFVRESRRTGKNEGEAQGAMMDLVE